MLRLGEQDGLTDHPPGGRAQAGIHRLLRRQAGLQHHLRGRTTQSLVSQVNTISRERLEVRK